MKKSNLKIMFLGLLCFFAFSTITTVLATDATAPTEFANPLGDVKTVSQLVTTVLSNLKGIVASISIVFIVVGGIKYILSAGVDKDMESAKKTISAAIIGLAIALAAPTFLKEVMNILGGNVTGIATTDEINQALTIREIAMKTLSFLLSIVGILGMIGLIVGGGFYLAAYGEEDRIKKGKSIITASLIGVAVALAALVIVGQVSSLLGVK